MRPEKSEQNPLGLRLRPLDLWDQYTHSCAQLLAVAENLAESISSSDPRMRPYFEEQLLKHAHDVAELREAMDRRRLAG